MEDNSELEATEGSPTEGETVGPGSRKRRRGLPKEERGRTSESWKTKLQKWMDGGGEGGQRKR